MEVFYQLRHYEGSHLLLSVCGRKLIQQTLIKIDAQISKIYEFHKENAKETTIEAKYVSLEIFAFSQHIIVVETITNCSIIEGTLYKEREGTLYNYNEYREEKLRLDTHFVRFYNYNGLIYLVPYYGDEIYVLSTLKSNSIIHFPYEKLYNTPNGIFITIKGANNLYKLSSRGNTILIKDVCADWIDSNLFENYGIIISPRKRVFNISGFIKRHIGKYDSTQANNIMFMNCGQRGVISKGGSIAYSPFEISSETGMLGLTIEDDKVYLHTKETEGMTSQEEQFSQKEIFKFLYDNSSYRNVLFSEDGSMFLSRKLDNIELVNIKTNERITFDNYVGVDSFNGFRPTFKYDSHRKIRLINPLNGQEIDTKLVNKYRFVSPNSIYYARTELYEYIEYYNRLENKIISREEYITLVKKYRSGSNMRTLFIHKHCDFLLKQYRKQKTASTQTCIQDIHKLKETDFIDLFIEKRGIAKLYKIEDDTVSHIIRFGDPLWFLNYVAFSYDEKYVAIAGKYPEGSGKSGLLLVYNLEKKEIVYQNTSTKAVWTAAFSKNDFLAAYTSSPTVYINTYPYKSDTIQRIPDYSFLSFSPDGSLIAMSAQGYIPCNNGENSNWGHQPSCLVSIRNTKKPEEAILSFTDLSSMGIEGEGFSRTVSSVSFSNNNEYILMVGKDGVVIIRKL